MRQIVTTVVFVLAAACGCTANRGIVGSWRFEKEVDTLADGTEAPSVPGEGYHGFVVFTPSGRFVGTIVPRGRRWTIDAVAPDELRRSVSATDASFGTYRLDPKTKTLRYQPEGSLDPTIEGTEQVRGYRLSGDTLVLSGFWDYAGTKRHFDITWRRVD